MAKGKRRERTPEDAGVADATTEAPRPVAQSDADAGPWTPPPGLTRRGWAILIGVVLLANLPVIHYALRGRPERTVELPYQDDFSRKETIAANYWTSGGLWRVVDGALLSPGVRNNPLWLKASLPQDVAVDFDVRTTATDGDIRVEIFGDGTNHSSGYLLVHGGWNNTLSIIGRLDDKGRSLRSLEEEARRFAAEHQLPSAGLADTGVMKADTRMRVEGSPFPVQAGKTYHWRIERRGGRLSWSIDGQPFLALDDPFPLVGPDHDRFGLSSENSDVYYDNLRIQALDGSTAALPPPPPVVAPPTRPAGPFEDAFDRPALGPDWNATDPGAVRLVDGALVIENGHNHPVWLNTPLPESAVIELDAWSTSPAGDIKVELYGDGRAFHTGPPNGQYTATGYVLVFGGWNNRTSVIARKSEHAPGRVERSDVPVEVGRKYHWKITRAGGRLSWEIDGKPFLEMNDPAPLTGPGNAHFAFSDWEAQLHFDNLRIRPL